MPDSIIHTNVDRELYNSSIAVKKTLEIFSDNWSFAVLQALFSGVKRFDDFQRHLNISRSVLTRRLKHLHAQGIISRTEYSLRPKRYEYRLTERGIDMYPIFLLLKKWGETWLDDAQTENLELIHKPCGHSLEVSVTCDACNQEVTARNVIARNI